MVGFKPADPGLKDSSLGNLALEFLPNSSSKSMVCAMSDAVSVHSSPSLSSPAPLKESGLAPLLLTVTELIRQLMEAQIIRRMESGLLSDEQLDQAADSIRSLEEQTLKLCEIFDIDPADLNVNLGELGTLLPKNGGYYPGQDSQNPSILELLDRLLHTGIVVQGDVDLGIAQLDLIHLKLRVMLTSQPT